MNQNHSLRSSQGTITLVGLAYDRAGMPVVNTEAIAEADVVIGHASFIEQVADLIAPDVQAYDVLDRVTADQDFRQLRVREAADHAARGRSVVMLSSGDPGVWGMASYVIAAVGGEVPVRVLPAVAAFQLAAARVGAPLMAGFAACALCDDLEPAEIIWKRLRAAADGGFVTVVYKPRYNAEENPDHYPIDRFPQFHPPRERSNSMLRQLAECFRGRPGDTPVVIGADLGTPEETITRTTLAEFEHVIDQVPLTSVLIIGNEHVSRAGDLLMVSR